MSAALALQEGQTSGHLSDRAWMHVAYVLQRRSTRAIAKAANCSDSTVRKWLKHHDIATRSIAEAVAGEANGMCGRRGADHPGYRHGGAAPRQCASGRIEGRMFRLAVLNRDRHRCQRCWTHERDLQPDPRHKSVLEVHHIKSWRNHPELRFDPDNGVTLCVRCHDWVESAANIMRRWMA